MLKTFRKTTTLALAATAALAVSAVMAPAVTLSFTDGGGNGKFIALPPSPDSISFAMISNNNGKKNKDAIYGGTTGATESLIVTGLWSFFTKDKRNASQDPLGYFIGSVFTALSFPKKAPAHEGGSFSFLVPANTFFGWVLSSTDGKKGRSHGVITADIDVAPVPLPAGGLMLLSAVAGLAALRRRKGAAV